MAEGRTVVELAEVTVAAPLKRLGIDPHWTSPGPWGADVRRLAEARRARPVRARYRHARYCHAEPVHGRLGPLAFRRAARAGVEDRPADRPRRSSHCRRGCAAAAPLLILEEAPTASERDPSAPNFDPRYRFETFIVGKANEVAATAARTLATSKTVSFNPLFIHGGTGRGKTHLLHAIGHAFLPRTAALASFRCRPKVHGRVHPGPEGK